MEYPIDLREQVKLLKENEEFFKTFGKFTEPYPDKLVRKIAEEYKDRPFDIYKEYATLPFIKEDINHFLRVKDIEDYMARGTCTSSAMFACAVFRTMGYPAAVMTGIDVRNLFNSVDNFFNITFIDHSVCLVKIDGKWYIYDIGNGSYTRYLSLGMIANRYIPGLIFRDPSDLGIVNKQQLFGLTLLNLKDVLLLDFQEDLVVRVFYDIYRFFKDKYIKEK